MCYPEIMNVKTVANQTDFFKRERQNFKEEVSKHYWKKFWVIAILKTVHKKKGLEPSIHPFFSMQWLQYVDEMSLHEWYSGDCSSLPCSSSGFDSGAT